jgi:hypothetical protein
VWAAARIRRLTPLGSPLSGIAQRSQTIALKFAQIEGDNGIGCSLCFRSTHGKLFGRLGKRASDHFESTRSPKACRDSFDEHWGVGSGSSCSLTVWTVARIIRAVIRIIEDRYAEEADHYD